MVIQKDIMDMYFHLKTTDNSISDEALDFMKEVCLAKVSEDTETHVCTANKLEIIMDFLSIENVEDICPQCGGRGRRTYSSTSAWRGSISGQQMTVAVCDMCWGSGDITHKGVDLRALTC